MRSSCKKIITAILFLLLQHTCIIRAFATNDPIQTDPKLGSLGQVTAGMVSSVRDQKYFENPAAIEATHVIKNNVGVGIEEGYTSYIPTDFSVTVKLKITKFNSSEQASNPETKTFVVEFKKGDGLQHNAYQYYAFENAYRVDVEIVSVEAAAGISWDVSKVLRIENTLEPIRDYNFPCSLTVKGLTVAYLTDQDELEATWNLEKKGETEYDFEWAWIDYTAVADFQNSSNEWLADKIFENNGTRITTERNGYNIPLLYDDGGYIFVRVRPVQMKVNGQRIEGNWVWQKWTETGGQLGTENNGLPVVYVFNGHERSLNWQASTSFAEGGKRKSVIQYFDGTLKGRQTVTKDNTTQKTIVAESFYDYQGRPVIQVLPAPTLSSIIEYSESFNRGTGYEGYPKWAYDKLGSGASVCGNPATALDNNFGSSRYYSPQNEILSLPNSEENKEAKNIAKYIPDAQQYPLTETRFAPDGRPAAQSGVGPNHQLGSNHETKYFYEAPAQQELDALFGTDAGVASHYFKNLVKDANGQYSVSYVDMHGRTVATALAGQAPGSVDALNSLNEQEITKQLIDESNQVNERSIISTKSIVVPKTGDYEFSYALTPPELKLKTCSNPPADICFDCLYKVRFTITSECNSASGFHVYSDSIENFTLNQFLEACDPGGLSPAFLKSFTVNLAEGSYTVTKELILSGDAQDYYREYFMANDTCRKFQQFFDKEYNILTSKSNCDLTCESCKASLGANINEFRQKFMQESGIQAIPEEMDESILAAYNEALANCNKICNPGKDDGLDFARDLKTIMLLDLTPPKGQYARVNLNGDPQTPDNNFVFNILNKQNYKVPVQIDANGNTVDNGFYYNEFGQKEQDVIASSLTREQFLQQFKGPWAEQLLVYHPEFYKLKATLTTLASSYQFEATLNKINDWASAYPYISNMLAQDDFFKPGGVGNAMYYSQMQTKLQNYANNIAPDPQQSCPGGSFPATLSISMLKIAEGTVFCNASPTCTSLSCFNTFRNDQSASPSPGCTDDWNLVWKTFRTLYLTERKKFISDYLATLRPAGSPVDASITAASYQLRFSDMGALNYTNLEVDPALQNFFNLAGGSGSTSQANAAGQQLAADQYHATCLAYAETWIADLKTCPTLANLWSNQTTYNADRQWLIPRLTQICESGSDETHISGSQSIKPGGTPAQGGYTNFPDVINAFLQSKGINAPFSEVCHPYLITVPGANYNVNKSPLVNKVIVTRPAQCECDRITQLQTEYLAAGFPGTFQKYLQVLHGAEITEQDINTLLGLCNGTSSCKFLETPIKLPFAFECQPLGSEAKACIDCITFKAIQDDFLITFNKLAPIANPQTDAEINTNIAFQNFANVRTGFGKNWTAYTDFMAECAAANLNSGYNQTGCSELENILNSFIATDAAPQTSWQWSFNPEPPELPNFANSNPAEIIQNGMMKIPDDYINREVFLYSHAEGNSTTPICVNDGYVYESRVVPASTTYFMRITCGVTAIYFKENGGGGILIQTLNAGSMDLLRGSAYNTGNLGIDLGQPHTYKISYIHGVFKFFIDNILIYTSTWVNHQPVSSFSSFSTSINGNSGGIDWVKIYNESGALILLEDFNSQTQFSIPDEAFLCQFNQGCQNRFTAYFNSVYGAGNTLSVNNYTYHQIDSIYYVTCNKHAAPCDDGTDNYFGPQLCGLNKPLLPPGPPANPPCSDLVNLAYTAAEEKYDLYIDSLRNVFDTAYYNKCMSVKSIESFTVKYKTSEYHYTLYYYDQAGNLVQTVPPEGVQRRSDNTFLDAVKAKRQAVVNGAAEAANSLTPAHSLITEYRYNTLNQVVVQRTPDAGINQFWYDVLGRLIVSQNARQAVHNKYSYTIYDKLGRIIEVGEKPQNSPPVNPQDEMYMGNWLNTVHNKTQITHTFYDLSYYDGQDFLSQGLNPPVLVQRNLRNRVSCTALYDVEPQSYSAAGEHNVATFYSYDIHGNVDTLVQDLNKEMTALPGNRFKKITYDYDLISGKVNKVAYQHGLTDQFYHVYDYDDENRITGVKTSHDSLIWETDARYSYYRHGPVARTIIGQQQVQGIDYAYTIQGWLKGVNSSNLVASTDMGQDGMPDGTVINQIPADVYGFNLNYFTNDYLNIAGPGSFAIQPGLPASDKQTGSSLFNGNISSMGVNIPKLGAAQLYGYRYDQLNRIIAMDAFTGFDAANNSWHAAAVTPNYKERISYDANGNILSYFRNGNKSSQQNMDDLHYHYNYYPANHPLAGKLMNNKLRHVNDDMHNEAAYSENDQSTGVSDIENQADDNYDYDETGNLTKDTKEGIGVITWNVYGKIVSIQKASGTIFYTYDAGGNRISKTANGKKTWYVRDASGNVMSMYVTDPAINSGHITQSEVYLYGSSRIGVFNLNRDVSQIAQADYSADLNTFVRGKKQYELTNHLGNVLVTVSDRKVLMLPDNNGGCSAGTGFNILNLYTRVAVAHYVARQEINFFPNFESQGDDDFIVYIDNTLGNCDDASTLNPPAGSYYRADVITATDYYPGGMTMPGRKYGAGSSSYHYGQNGQEKDNELNENIYTAEYWEYDSRIMRRWNIDPVVKEWETPYLCFSGNPIFYADPDGLNPEDPKGKTLQEVIFICKRPKEGAERINPEVLKTPTSNDFTHSISDLLTVTPGGIKPTQQKEITNPFQKFHRGSKYFDAGWYDADVYDLTTYDWDNGQVMGERDWLDKLATQTDFNDYTPVDGVWGGRNWNGQQVNDNGFLTGNLYSGRNPFGIQEAGGNPVKAIRNASRFLNTLAKVMKSTGSRTRLLGKIQNQKLKNLTNDLFRPNARVGDGSSMSAFRFEQATGLAVGGRTHAIKLLNYRTALMKIWKARANLNSFDKRITKELLKDIQHALQGN